MSNRRPTGLFGFTVISLGQFVSFLGSGMTRFALTFWAWQETGEATALAQEAGLAEGQRGGRQLVAAVEHP